MTGKEKIRMEGRCGGLKMNCHVTNVVIVIISNILMMCDICCGRWSTGWRDCGNVQGDAWVCGCVFMNFGMGSGDVWLWVWVGVNKGIIAWRMRVW